MRRRRARRGMSLLEVMIALVILGLVMLGMGNFVGRFVRGTRDSAVIQTCSDLAVDRLETVKGATVYANLSSYATTESTISGYPGYQRVTQVAHVGGNTGDLVDYMTITVTVTAPGNAGTVEKTTMIAKF